MIYLAIAVAVGIHAQALKWTRVVDCAQQIISISLTSVATLSDPNLTDDEKGRYARESSARLFGRTAVLIGRFALAVAAPVVFFALLIKVGLVELPLVVSTLESWPVIIVATLAILAWLFWRPILGIWRR